MSLTERVSRELSLPARGVAAVVELLAEGSTVPFIARYRKEKTGGLDEVQIRDIQDRHAYHTDLEARRATILNSIESQGKLTDALRAKILAATSKSDLEDLYLPYKKKRRTRGQIAIERGLEPLALRIIEQPEDADPSKDAAAFVDPEKDVPDVGAALAGAQDIVAERIADDANVRASVRKAMSEDGIVECTGRPSKIKERTKFEDYYAYSEPVRKIPSHRYLAIRRGETEGVLAVDISVERERLLMDIGRRYIAPRRSAYRRHLGLAIQDSFDRLVKPGVESDVRAELKARADRSAVEVFAENLKNLLLAPPVGAKAIIGIDPGLRTGCKCAAVDATGRFVETITIYLHKPDQAKVAIAAFVKKHAPYAVAIGNGTGGRETETFVKKALKDAGVTEVVVVPVSEAGASVYSASDIAREEFGDLDLTIRGAISIARRLSDPLAELVKVDPKAIGVGQYQHDVHQPLLRQKLDDVVESCVNAVGVDLNTASAPLLARVAGIGPKLSKAVVAHRETTGAFKRRRKLLDVSGLGPKAFEQCSGFLRIPDGADPLDRSAVHPERYKLVGRIAKDLGVDLAKLVGDAALADRIEISRYVDDEVGEPTLRDIVDELKKPGRDPRSGFEPPKFRDDVTEMAHLKTGMALEGVVTNVTNFGAFVDVGVHQDGLVHVSQLSDRYVDDPNKIVKVGDRLTVRVLEVDLVRKRISLTAKSGEGAQPRAPKDKPNNPNRRRR